MHPRVLLPVLAALLATAPAFARPPAERPDNLLDDRFGLQATLGWTSTTTTVRFDADDGSPGTVLSAEDDLGLDKSSLVGRGEVWFRMRERHRARLASYYLPLDRRARTVLDRTIEFGNETFVLNEEIESQLELRILAITYSYSFIRNDRLEAAASLGFDVIGFEAEATVPARLRTERQDRSGPAPLGGLDATFRISKRFYGEVRGQYLSVTIDEVSGSLQTYEANLLWRWNPNVTIGLGYSGLRLEVDSQDPGDSGLFELSTGGPQLFARVGF